MADVEHVISSAPNNPVGYEEHARLQLQYGLDADPEAILRELNRAIELAQPPDAAQAYFLRGWAILNFPLVEGVPNPQAALEDLRESVSLDPKQAEAQFTLAQALLAAKDPGEALTAANRAVELESKSAPSRKLRAHIQFALGDFHAAIDDLTTAIGLEADTTAQATLYAERAYLKFRLNALADAQSDLDTALSLAPDSKIARYVQMRLDPSLPRPDSSQLDAARADAPDDPIWQTVMNDLLSIHLVLQSSQPSHSQESL